MRQNMCLIFWQCKSSWDPIFHPKTEWGHQNEAPENEKNDPCENQSSKAATSPAAKTQKTQRTLQLVIAPKRRRTARCDNVASVFSKYFFGDVYIPNVLLCMWVGKVATLLVFVERSSKASGYRLPNRPTCFVSLRCEAQLFQRHIAKELQKRLLRQSWKTDLDHPTASLTRPSTAEGIYPSEHQAFSCEHLRSSS